MVWTNSGSVFFIGSDVEIVKDVAAHRDGRENSLASTEAFTKTQAKTDSSHAQAIWFLDVAKVVKAVIKSTSNAKEGDAQAQQTDVLVSELGVYGLKSVGGSLSLASGSYDSLTKTFFNAPKPVAGLLKVFSLPPVTLRPESWVPATVATYQTLSIDLDNVYTALNDLVNKFQPGMINVVEQQLVGPNGGQPLSFQNDIFGPLGDRITVISDFKKPIKEDSQRMLAAIALEDTKAFQSTMLRLFEITGAAPEKREFQGTTIYDFTVTLPNGPQGNAPQGLNGPISIAVAKDTLFRDHRHDAPGTSAPPRQRPTGRELGVPDSRQRVPGKSERLELRPARRVGPSVVRSGQERSVRESHPAGFGSKTARSRYTQPRQIDPC